MEEASSVPILGAVGEQIKRIKPLSLLPLVALIFYDVSGGPFGTEDAVSSGGPMLALLAFLILPFVWSVPEALVTAELATTFPENSGYVAWVTAAFGPFWGFQEGFWSWVSGVTDNSLYPVMFMSYLEAIIPALADGWQRRLLLFGVSITLSYVNYRGLTIVGRVAVGMTFFIVLPFVVLVGMSVPQIEPSNWKQMDWNAVKWGPFLNVMFWNLNYWDSVSTLAGEVPRPHKTFPRALAGAVVLVVLTYLLPLMAGLGVDADPDQWQLGFYASLAEKIGGRWLGWWIVAAAAVSQIGQFEAEMSSDSFQLQGMAERGFLPACLARRSKHDTPTLGIILSSLGVCTLVTFNFLQIVELLNIVYCLAELLEFVAFIYLRIKSPHLHRPYKVPLPTWGCALMLLPASCLLCTLLVMPVLRLDWQVMGWTLGTVVVGGAMYPLLQTARERGWCEFVGVSPHDFKASLFEGLPIAATPSLSNLHLLHDSQPQSEDES
ncbi:hypothetical protein WJX72_006764 [[Myrmecia] bisecta]|uniref:Amino acid transporter n=1 Tax=[Myrmecia] bisecta TaxID=41462 RepID=A0AAW1PXR7_9CHLO